MTITTNVLKYDDCNIVLIENYPCSSNYELEARERTQIETTPCVNKSIPTRTSHEYKLAHFEETKEYNKQYYQINNEKLIETQQEAYEKNKHKINEKAECCVCGRMIMKREMKSHQARQICQDTQITF